MFPGGFGTIYTSLTGDPTEAPSSCTHANDVSIFCKEENATVCASGNVRLTGSSDNSQGRVEVCVDNQWGSICDDSWSPPSTALTCKLLNKFGGELISPVDFLVNDTVPILLDDVKCTGSESNFLSCPQLSLSLPHDCSHTEDVAVRCLG